MAKTFLEELGEAMTREMTERGPIEAIIVCTKLAPDIAGRLSRERGKHFVAEKTADAEMAVTAECEAIKEQIDEYCR